MVKKSWWTQKAFTSNTAKHTKAVPVKRPAKEKIEKCSGCRKSRLDCRCDTISTKPVVAKGRAKRGEAKKEPEPVTKHGVAVCGTCGCYLFPNGMCRNRECSTR